MHQSEIRVSPDLSPEAVIVNTVRQLRSATHAFDNGKMEIARAKLRELGFAVPDGHREFEVLVHTVLSRALPLLTTGRQRKPMLDSGQWLKDLVCQSAADAEQNDPKVFPTGIARYGSQIRRPAHDDIAAEALPTFSFESLPLYSGGRRRVRIGASCCAKLRTEHKGEAISVELVLSKKDTAFQYPTAVDRYYTNFNGILTVCNAVSGHDIASFAIKPYCSADLFEREPQLEAALGLEDGCTYSFAPDAITWRIELALLPHGQARKLARLPSQIFPRVLAHCKTNGQENVRLFGLPIGNFPGGAFMDGVFGALDLEGDLRQLVTNGGLDKLLDQSRSNGMRELGVFEVCETSVREYLAGFRGSGRSNS